MYNYHRPSDMWVHCYTDKVTTYTCMSNKANQRNYIAIYTYMYSTATGGRLTKFAYHWHITSLKERIV